MKPPGELEAIHRDRFRHSAINSATPRPAFTNRENPPWRFCSLESLASIWEDYPAIGQTSNRRSLTHLTPPPVLEHASRIEMACMCVSIVEDHFKLILSRLQRVEDQVALLSQGVHELAQRAQEAEARRYARLIAASEARGVALNCSRRGQGRYREIYKHEFDRIYDVELNRLLTMGTLASSETLRGQPGKV